MDRDQEDDRFSLHAQGRDKPGQQEKPEKDKKEEQEDKHDDEDVEEALEESFPASDPPSYSPGTA